MRVHRPPLATPRNAPSRAPSLLRRASALVVAGGVVATALLTSAVTAPPASAGTSATASTTAAVAEDTFTAKLNYARTSRGLPRLDTRAALVAVARRQAARMAENATLFHNPNLTSDVTNWRWVGENVGYGPDAVTVHVAFMGSSAHKANILDRDYTQVGIGVVVRDGRVWVAEVFRRPLRVSTSSKGIAAAGPADRTLRLGSTGPSVRRLQARLGLPTTGVYGPTTKAAVSRFQRHLGWVGRGNCGPHTWARLF